MGFIKKLLGMEDVEITEDMKVAVLKRKFKESFGTEIRVYKTLNTGKGSRLADDKDIISNIGDTSKKNRKITIKKSMTVGEVKEKFKEKMGIKRPYPLLTLSPFLCKFLFHPHHTKSHLIFHSFNSTLVILQSITFFQELFCR